ncbi:heme peroxidase [Mycena vulgaris]|nr:heme peroxidase [Mycena vulgaris]
MPVLEAASAFYLIIPHWWNLPLYVALIYLGATRNQLSAHNLYDTYRPGEFPVSLCPRRAARTLNGLCNNLDIPGMGSVGTRFSRFVPINVTYGETDSLYTPNPRTISQNLFKRKTFTPATSINLLAAAWIQFQTHDWFSHGAVNDPDSLMSFPLPANDPLRANGQTNMTVRRTLKETHPDRPATYINTNTHWWDLSQVYGADEATHATLRANIDGKMKVAEDGLLPSQRNPSWTDTEIFDHARLVTTALNAKIHTVEWTPALLQDDILQRAMDTNWYGLAPEWLQTIPNIFSQQIAEVWYGIIGGKPDFAGVAFAHSEEFVSVYRFHSLLRDNITIRSHVDGTNTANTYNISQYAFRGAQDVIRGNNFSDVVFTFGVDYPGALASLFQVLGNYPAQMMSLSKPGAPYVMDMGAIDVLRDRERGVPRYNEFRRLFSLIPAKTMDDISDNKAAVASLRAVYGEDVESVDLLAGSLAESPRATGFAFSNTQFQAFILAASRRLMTDRFFTTDYTAAVYTQQGLDYIQNSDFRAVIGRTVPGLNASAHSVDNAFKPWLPPDEGKQLQTDEPGPWVPPRGKRIGQHIMVHRGDSINSEPQNCQFGTPDVRKKGRRVEERAEDEVVVLLECNKLEMCELRHGPER